MQCFLSDLIMFIKIVSGMIAFRLVKSVNLAFAHVLLQSV